MKHVTSAVNFYNDTTSVNELLHNVAIFPGSCGGEQHDWFCKEH